MKLNLRYCENNILVTSKAMSKAKRLAFIKSRVLEGPQDVLIAPQFIILIIVPLLRDIRRFSLYYDSSAVVSLQQNDRCNFHVDSCV